MTKFESSVKQIPYPVENVYRNISDLSNLERVRDRKCRSCGHYQAPHH